VTSSVGSGPYPLTWATRKETNYSQDSVSLPSQNRCPSPLKEVDFVGTVTSRSGPWTKQYLGDTVSFDQCVTFPGFEIVSLVPGTVFSIG